MIILLVNPGAFDHIEWVLFSEENMNVYIDQALKILECNMDI